MFKLFHTVVDIAVNDVAVPMIDELLDRMDNVRNMVRDAGIDVGAAYMKLIHDFKISLDIAVSNHVPRHAFFIGFTDDLVIYIGEVLYMGHIIAFMFKEAMDNVPHNERTGIANMGMVVRRDAADVDAHLPRMKRNEFLFFAGHCIIYTDGTHIMLLS